MSHPGAESPGQCFPHIGGGVTYLTWSGMIGGSACKQKYTYLNTGGNEGYRAAMIYCCSPASSSRLPSSSRDDPSHGSNSRYLRVARSSLPGQNHPLKSAGRIVSAYRASQKRISIPTSMRALSSQLPNWPGCEGGVSIFRMRGMLAVHGLTAPTLLQYLPEALASLVYPRHPGLP